MTAVSFNATSSSHAGNWIDLRSDTVTAPCEGMREAMASADVGDDVFGEDPTVNALEIKTAELLNKEAGLYLSSGTQSNLLAILSHCGRGEEFICGRPNHVFTYEAGGAAVLGSVVSCPLEVAADFSLDPADVAKAIKEDDSHFPMTRLLCLENTTYGKALPLDRLQEPLNIARAAGLAAHLDGARFFNAITKLGVEPQALSGMFDTVSVCLSKGLGAPVGSVLVGPADLIARARRMRKMLGGGMRQAGIIAAAGLYALEHNLERLADDHRHAAQLAANLQEIGELTVTYTSADTNMVFIAVPQAHRAPLQQFLLERGVKAGLSAELSRLVIHKDISEDNLDQVTSSFNQYFG